MANLVLETHIDAPADICFDLARDPRVNPGMSAPPGPITLGQHVTFETVRFGIRGRLTVAVVELDRPHRFVDEMTDGWFGSFTHAHDLIAKDGGTLLRDTLTWTSPFGIFGKLIDGFVLKRHLEALVKLRNKKLKALAEARG